MLTLPIKKKWFDMILSGEKKEEYRDINPYYTKRFMNIFAPYWSEITDGYKFFIEECECDWYNDELHQITFRNGYRKDSPSFVATCTLAIGFGKEEWGAEWGKRYFILKIRDVEPQESEDKE